MNINSHSAYWYVRFYNNFFDSKAVKDIERLPDSRFSRNFSSFVIHLYFKMVAYSIEVDGNLIFDLTMEENEDLAYSIAKTFGFTDKLGEVKEALMQLERNGLIETVKTEEYNQLFIPYVPDNTGRLSLNSYQRAQRRIKAKRGESLTDTKLRAYGKLKNVYLTESEYGRLRSELGDIGGLIQAYSVTVLQRTKKESDYNSLRRFARAIEGDADG